MYVSSVDIMWICVVLNKNFNEVVDQKVVILTRNPAVKQWFAWI